MSESQKNSVPGTATELTLAAKIEAMLFVSAEPVPLAQLAQALDATSHVLANLPRVVLGIQRKRPVAVVRVLVVPLAEKLQDLFAADGGLGIEEAHRGAAEQNQGSRNPKNRKDDVPHRVLAPSRSARTTRAVKSGSHITITNQPTVS